MPSDGKFLNVVKQTFTRKFITRTPGFRQTRTVVKIISRSEGSKQSVVRKVVGQRALLGPRSPESQTPSVVSQPSRADTAELR